MNKQEANEKISNNLEQMKKLFEECKVLAKEHALNLDVSFPGVEEAGFDIEFNPDKSWKWESYVERLKREVKDGDLTEEAKNILIEEKKKKFKGEISWHSSSLSCAMSSYDDYESDIFED